MAGLFCSAVNWDRRLAVSTGSGTDGEEMEGADGLLPEPPVALKSALASASPQPW